MKFRKIKLESLIYPIILLILLFLLSCTEDREGNKSGLNYEEQAAFSPQKDAEIQKYNLEIKIRQSKERFPCDTIAVMQYVFDNYPAGTYLLESDRTTTYNDPNPAIIYVNENNIRYVLAVIASSRQGERLIEPDNIIGYDQSFIDLDSTELGTPFIYLLLLECRGEGFLKIWEAPVPSHGGFNRMSLRKWNYNQTLFAENNFHYGQGVGHINYNYFFINGIRNYPHLLMTYSGTHFRRTLGNINNDKFPDYYEHVFYNLSDKIYSRDSVAFVWSITDTLYINTRNSKQTRRY